ncbi:MAG: DmsE family decaheme c-type cytochrome [Pseudomonadales bacterium]|nr:DmsE family decaheme c-type cytochrome [Pseudomonadales bacterium]
MTTGLLMLSLLCLTLLLPETALAACLKCHDEQEAPLAFQHRTQGLACTQCHGVSAAHEDKPRVSPDQTFRAGAAGEAASAPCLHCHQDAERRFWPTSDHGQADVACSSCHAIHQPERNDPGEPASTKCESCHAAEAARLRYPVTHPLQAGSMACSDCHSPHGNEGSLLPTDKCVRCHQDKNGPFLFEHEPVTEDCALCHEPHGSTLPALLNNRPPFLCQSCHMAASHPSRMPVAAGGGDLNMTGKSCLNCHQQVHGSNHPSGARFTR